MPSDQTYIANIEILQSDLTHEHWHNTFWAKYSGEVDISERENGNPVLRPSGNPIEILREYQTEGRDNMLIPFLDNLSGAPRYGDVVVKGTGESQVQKWLRSYINQVRKAVMVREGRMSEQRELTFRLFDQAMPQLRDYFSVYESQEVSRAFYEGVSRNLSTTNAEDGLGLYKRYHPNFYYSTGSSVVTKVATTEGQTPTAAELDTAEAAAIAATAKLLQNLRVKLMTLKIPQIVSANGVKYWPMLVHPGTLVKLWNDSQFYTAQRTAFEGARGEAPELNDMSAWYAGFALFEDVLAVRWWDNAAGGFFGDDDTDPISSMLNPSTGTDNYCSIIFANQAMGKGVAEDLNMTEEVDDHGNIKEVAGNLINGYNRADFALEAVAGETSSNLFRKNTTGGVASGIAALNQSSLIIMTDDG